MHCIKGKSTEDTVAQMAWQFYNFVSRRSKLSVQLGMTVTCDRLQRIAHHIAVKWVKDQKQQLPICCDVSHLDHSVLQACCDTQLCLSTQYQLRPFGQWNSARTWSIGFTISFLNILQHNPRGFAARQSKSSTKVDFAYAVQQDNTCAQNT